MSTPDPKSLQGLRNAVALQYQLGAREDIHPPDADLAINAAIQTVYAIARHKNNQYAKRAVLSVVGGVAETALPPDFMDMSGIVYRESASTPYYPANPKDFIEFEAREAGVDNMQRKDSTAPVYLIVGRQIQFLPRAVANDAQGARLVYLPSMLRLVDAGDVTTILDDHLPLVESLSTAFFYQARGQQEIADRWMQTYLMQIQVVLGEEHARLARAAVREKLEV